MHSFHVLSLVIHSLIFNCQLINARRVVENILEVVANRYWVLFPYMNLAPENGEKVTLASCILCAIFFVKKYHIIHNIHILWLNISQYSLPFWPWHVDKGSVQHGKWESAAEGEEIQSGRVPECHLFKLVVHVMNDTVFRGTMVSRSISNLNWGHLLSKTVTYLRRVGGGAKKHSWTKVLSLVTSPNMIKIYLKSNKYAESNAICFYNSIFS